MKCWWDGCAQVKIGQEEERTRSKINSSEFCLKVSKNGRSLRVEVGVLRRCRHYKMFYSHYLSMEVK